MRGFEDNDIRGKSRDAPLQLALMRGLEGNSRMVTL